MKRLLFSILVALVLYGCNESESTNPVSAQNAGASNTTHPKSAIKCVDIVLCDLTSSMVNRDRTTKKILDSIPLQNIKKDAARVWSEADFGTKVIYVGLNNSDFNPVIFEDEKVNRSVKAGMFASVKRRYDVEIPQLIQDTISKVFNPGAYDKTCLTHALNNVYTKFKCYKSGEKLRLFILSDMMEDCSQSPLGYLSFERPEKLKRTKETLDTTSKQLVHDLNALGVEVYMVYESDNVNYNINMETMRYYWLRILGHYGYKDDSRIYADNLYPPRYF